MSKKWLAFCILPQEAVLQKSTTAGTFDHTKHSNFKILLQNDFIAMLFNGYLLLLGLWPQNKNFSCVTVASKTVRKVKIKILPIFWAPWTVRPSVQRQGNHSVLRKKSVRLLVRCDAKFASSQKSGIILCTWQFLLPEIFSLPVILTPQGCCKNFEIIFENLLLADLFAKCS